MAVEEQTKKRTRIIVITVLSVLIFAVVFGLLFGSKDENDTTNTQYYIGDTVTHKNVSIKVTSVEDTQKYSIYSTSFNFVVIYFTVKNNSNSTISINPLYCELSMGNTVYDCKAYDYDIYNIVPGGTIQLSMAYETVKKSTEADYLMKFGYSILNSKVIEINLKEKS